MSSFFDIRKPTKSPKKGDIFPLMLILKEHGCDSEGNITIGSEDNFCSKDWEELIGNIIEELIEIKKKGVEIFNKYHVL